MVDMKEIKAFIKECIKYVHNEENTIAIDFLKVIENDEEKASTFCKELDVASFNLKEDIEFFMDSDPAVDSMEEIILSYPGYRAITYYRVAHVLRLMGYHVIARIISEKAHSKTGIDIHPGATIGVPFFIDHGTGIVIGETTIIGERVKLYQGVTLGALSLGKGHLLKGTKRHPTIGNDVTIYSGASILGDISIGDDVTIGSNVFLTESIPPHMRVTIGKPLLVLKEKV